MENGTNQLNKHIKLYIYQDSIRTIIYSEEFVQSDKFKLFADFLLQFNFVPLDSDSYLAKKFLLKKEQIMQMYRIRFSKILRTDYIKKENDILIYRKIINSDKEKFNSKDFYIKIEKERKFFKYPTYVEYLKNNNNEKVLLEKILYFIDNTLAIYGLDNKKMLPGEVFDITPANAVISEDKIITFFDQEFALRKKMLLSLYIYRVLSATPIKNRSEVYEKLKHKYGLEQDYDSLEYKNQKLCEKIDTNYFYIPFLKFHIKAFWNKELCKYFKSRRNT